MKLDEKLYRLMVQRGLSQQALAREAGVSDSEVSRLLNGQSKRPGLHNILRLARALGVSLDYLADDSRGEDTPAPPPALSADEAEVLDLARQLGPRDTLRVLEALRVLGPEVALRRLYGMEPGAGAGHGDSPSG